MKKRLAMLFLSCLPGFLPTMADDETGIFANVLLQSGDTESIMLRNDASYVGARFVKAQKTFTINGKTFDIADVKEITFEQRIITGIQELTSKATRQTAVDDNTLFDLSGRKVTYNKWDANQKPLPRGIYIRGGKKIVVR